MSQSHDQLYNLLFRAVLTEEALDKTGRLASSSSDIDHERIAALVSLDALDVEHLERARAMATVYTAIAAFENSVRELISKTLLENVGENWWSQCVSEKIRKSATTRMEEEKKVKWHAQRGEDPIQYTMLPNLLNIIRSNFSHFEPFIHDENWAGGIFDTIDRSRNVIMHSGFLEDRDIARIGSLIRDWMNQVST